MSNLTPWQRCSWCKKIVKVNKPILGSMHVCLTNEEILAIKQSQQAMQAQQTQVYYPGNSEVYRASLKKLGDV